MPSRATSVPTRLPLHPTSADISRLEQECAAAICWATAFVREAMRDVDRNTSGVRMDPDYLDDLPAIYGDNIAPQFQRAAEPLSAAEQARKAA